MAEKEKVEQEGSFQEFVFKEWLHDGLEGICGEMKCRRDRFDTSEFFTHMRNARKEKLLAVRSLLDNALAVLEKEEKEAEAQNVKSK